MYKIFGSEAFSALYVILLSPLLTCSSSLAKKNCQIHILSSNSLTCAVMVDGPDLTSFVHFYILCFESKTTMPTSVYSKLP